MGSEINSDKLTIKNILFTKALPNYTIPVATDGYKIFPCTDCGDKFLFESSYNDHINRKSLKITYYCRHCNKIILNYNRCRFLSHIRSHKFKTATINVSDLKIDPLPIQNINWSLTEANNSQMEIQILNDSNVCYECKQIIEKSDTLHRGRAKHYMKRTDTVYSCPICLFTLPNTCGLTAHLRIHLRIPPYFCPECGIHLSTRSISYPYNHDCEGFNMIRATTRIKCKQQSCNKIFHPNDYRVHVKSHFRNVYKCLLCSVKWFDESPKNKHAACKNKNKILKYVQCQLCSNKLLVKNEVNKHLDMHYKYLAEVNNDQLYPCLSCSLISLELPHFIQHQINKHASNKMQYLLSKILKEYGPKYKEKKLYRVIKKCDKCLRSFIYRCQYENIKILSNECPYKCSLNKNINNKATNEINKNLQMVCYLCKSKIKENWDDIKKHFATFHKNHKCLDLKVMLTKINNKILCSKSMTTHLKHVNGNMKNSMIKDKSHSEERELSTNNECEISLKTITDLNEAPTNENICGMCNFKSEDKQSFETHIITHRDPYMAYQCLECGQCFVVKPSFTTHLLLEHDIADVNEYINQKQCYNVSALLKQPHSTNSKDEPVKENQCKICRNQFENHIDLQKHFRVHGMAFLMKNTNKNSP